MMLKGAAPAFVPLALATFVLLAGCLEPREELEGNEPACSGCHGDGDDPAPPTGLWLRGGPTQTTDRGVGAHQRHLHPPKAAPLSSAVACVACHRVPASAEEAGHLDSDGRAEVTFSGREWTR